MKKILCGLVMLAMVICGVVYNVNAATLDEAKSMAVKAAGYAKANGMEKAAAEFNNQNGQFRKGDIYIVMIDYNGKVIAHGGSPALTGTSLLDQKDPNTGKFFVQEMISTAKKGSGWVTYNWMNPAAKKVQPKKSWIQKIEGVDAFTICGIFQ
ncbi:MAG: cache domain-containing protein [Proteobacteria bacterium]|nr:cache domain-containing protein [Pseudomonadota bacterium]